MRVRVNSGRKIVFRKTVYRSGETIDAPDEVAAHWVADGLVAAVTRAKPVLPARPLSPEPSTRGKR